MERTKTNTRMNIFLAVSAVLLFVGGMVAGQFVDVSFDSYLGNTTQVKNDNDRNLNYASVEEAFDTLVANYDGELSDEDLLAGLKKGLAEATGDPYTEFFTAEESKEFNEQITGSFTGIGAELGKEDNAIIVVSPIRGYPAEKAGLLPRDIIVKINDEDALSLSISEAVQKIRGPKDTDVKLSIIRGSEQLEFTITRTEIKIPSVEYTVEGNVCSIVISRFADDTDTIMKQAIKDCKAKSTTKVLLDLRNNPGGYLEQSIKVASHWVASGKPVVTEKRGGQVIKTHAATIGQEFAGMQTVVLVNEGSASASEIVAGALKDYKLATLVGTKTYGKGSVQEVDPLSGGSSIKITIARWFTPNDKNIDKEGIEPDEKVEITADQAKASQDPQKQKALDLLK